MVNNQFQTVPIAAYRQGDFSRRSYRARVIGTDPLGRQMLEGMIYDPNDEPRTVNGLLVRDQFPNNRFPSRASIRWRRRSRLCSRSPAGLRANALTNNYLKSYSTTRITEIPSVKIDQVIGAKGRLSFFWQRTKTANPNGNTIFGRSDGLPDPLTARTRHVPEPRLCTG